MGGRAKVRGVALRDDGTYNAAEECTNMSAVVSILKERCGKQKDAGRLVVAGQHVYSRNKASPVTPRHCCLALPTMIVSVMSILILPALR